MKQAKYAKSLSVYFQQHIFSIVWKMLSENDVYLEHRPVCVLRRLCQSRQILVAILFYQSAHRRDWRLLHDRLFARVQHLNARLKVLPQRLLSLELCHREGFLPHDAVDAITPLPHFTSACSFASPSNTSPLVYLTHGSRVPTLKYCVWRLSGVLKF